MPDPLVIQVMQANKAALLANEQAQMQAMAQRWRQVEANLNDQIELFVRRTQEEGLTASALRSRQWQLDRYRTLLRQVTVELDRYTDYAAPLIESQQRVYAQQGIQHASQAIQAVGVDNGVTIRFDLLPVSATENMVGLAGDGSPLRTLLRGSYGSAADGMLNELVRATAVGQNPRVTADRMVRNGLSQSLSRMLTISRTETLRVYKEASRQTYINSKVVNSYRRLATRDQRSCIGCLAEDGKEYPLNEPFASHPNCRCTLIPNVAGYKPAQWELGPAWLAKQTPDVQKTMLGAGRYALYKDGIDFDRFATTKTDETWGDAVVPTRLRDL